MIVRRELTYACDVDVRQMDLSTNRGWGQFRQAGPDHFRRVPKCVERGNGGVRLEDVHFRRGNDLFSEDNCDARIKNRIRSSNSRARSGNDPVRIVNNRDAFGNTRLRGGNNDLQDGINHSHCRGEYLFVDDVICVWRGNDRVGMTNDCGGRGNYLEIPPVFGPLTLRR